MTMYNLGNTYIGKAGIYCTTPVKKANQKRWAIISYTVDWEDPEYPEKWDREEKVIIGNGYCKEKELLNEVKLAERALKRRYYDAKLTVNHIEYFVED